MKKGDSIVEDTARVMAENPDIQAALSAKPGLIVDDGSAGQRKSSTAKARVTQKPHAPSMVDREIEAERSAAGSRFEENARKAIERSDKRESSEEEKITRREVKRGALLDEDPETEQVRDSSGRFTDKKNQKRETAEDEGGSGEEEIAEGEEEESAGEGNNDAPATKSKMTLEKALQILRLEKFSSKALAKMDPDDVIQLAIDRMPVRADVDAKIAELARLKKPSAQAAAEKPKGTPEQQQPATGEGTTFDFKKAATRLRELYDDDVVNGLEEPFQEIAKWTHGAIEAEKKNFEAYMAPILETLAHLQISVARSQLERAIPQLSEEAFFDKVKRQASKMDPAAYGNDLHALLSDASKVVAANESKGKPAQATREARHRAQPTTNSRRGRDETPVSRHDAFGQIAALIEDGRRTEAQELAELTG